MEKIAEVKSLIPVRAKQTKYEIPFNWEEEFLTFLGENKDKIHSVYGSLPGGITGRPIPHSNSVDNKKITDQYFADIIQKMKTWGINFNFIMNASCNGNIYFTNFGKQKLKDDLDKIADVGIDTITVANFDLARRISYINSKIRIILSVIFNITQLDQVHYARRQDFNFQGLVIGKGLNRNLPKLQNFLDKTNDLDVIVIANDFCPSANCPERITDHNNACAHKNLPFDEKLGEQYYIPPSTNCRAMTLKDTSYFLKAPIVNPNDVSLYRNIGTQSLKLSDRIMPSQKLMQVCNAYFIEDYSGNLFDLCSYTTYFDDSHLPQKNLTKTEVSEIIRYGYDNLLQYRNLFQLNPFVEAKSLSQSGFMKIFEKGLCENDCYDKDYSPNACKHCDHFTEQFLHIDKKVKEIIMNNISLLQRIGKDKLF